MPTSETVRKMKDNLNKISVKQLGVINKEMTEFRDKLNENASLRAGAI